MDKLKTRVLFVALIILALVSVSAVAAADVDDVASVEQDDIDLSEETGSDVVSAQDDDILADDSEPEQQENLDGSSYVTVKFVYMNSTTQGQNVEYEYKKDYQIKKGSTFTIQYSTVFSKLLDYPTGFEYGDSKYVFRNWTSSLTGEDIKQYTNQKLEATGYNYTVVYTAEYIVYPNTIFNLTWNLKDSAGEDVSIEKIFDLKYRGSITVFAVNFTNIIKGYTTYESDGWQYEFDHWEDGEGNIVDATVKHEYPYTGQNQNVVFNAIYKAKGSPSNITVELVGLKDVDGNDVESKLSNKIDPGVIWTVKYAMFTDDIDRYKTYDANGYHYTFKHLIDPDGNVITDPDSYERNLRPDGTNYTVTYTAVYDAELIGNFTLNYIDPIAHGSGSWSSHDNYGVDFTHTFKVPADIPNGAVFLYWVRNDTNEKFYPDSEDQGQFSITYEEFAGKDVTVTVYAVYNIKTEIELEEITGYVEDVVDITAKIKSKVSSVPDPIGGTATLTIDWSNKLANGLLMAGTYTQTVEVNDGQAVFEDITLSNPGTYKYSVKFNGYNYDVPSEGINDYLESEADSKLNVLPLDTTTTSDDVSGTAGDKVTITADIVDQNNNKVQNGTAVLKVNGKEYTAEVKDGKAVFEGVELPSESTEATIEYLGNDYYNPSNTTIQITVTPPEVPEEPEEPEEPEVPEEPTDEPVTPAAEKAIPVTPAAGNPIALVVLALLTLVSTVSFGRKR